VVSGNRGASSTVVFYQKHKHHDPILTKSPQREAGLNCTLMAHLGTETLLAGIIIGDDRSGAVLDSWGYKSQGSDPSAAEPRTALKTLELAQKLAEGSI
jgi:hypothetical protein